MRTAVIKNEDAVALRGICAKMGTPYTGEKAMMLKRLSTMELKQAKPLITYHDALLFMLAYPENEQQYSLTLDALRKVTSVAAALSEKGGERDIALLDGSGIAGTALQSAYSIDIIKWLLERYPANVSLYSIDADPKSLMAILKWLLPEAEYMTCSEADMPWEKIKHKLIPKDISEMEWLIELMDQSSMRQPMKDYIYETMKVYAKLTTDEMGVSRSYLRIPVKDIYYHTSALEKSTDVHQLMSEPIGKPIPLTPQKKQALVDAARMSLALLYRETDPVTYAETEAVQLYEMGRGVQVALYPIRADRRLPVDSYIGYMLFKNGIPVSYGGAWMWQYRAKIGVNIYPPFRGGESTWLFGQLMRLYKQLFEVRQFVVEPYQFGKNNPEGLQSGAFWFYYRMGFRPQDAVLAKLAASEYERICAQKGYRSELTTLKRLTGSDLRMDLMDIPSDEQSQYYDPAQISHACSAHIRHKYAGDRATAVTEVTKRFKKVLGIGDFKKWDEVSQKVAMNLMLSMDIIEDIEKWSDKDKLALLAIIKSKASRDESAYIKAVQRHKKLRSELAKYVRITV